MEHPDNRAMTVIFNNSLQKKLVDLQELNLCAEEFLQVYQHSDFALREFWDLVADENGVPNFNKLLEATGYAGDMEGFFDTALQEIAVGTGETFVIQCHSAARPAGCWSLCSRKSCLAAAIFP